LQLRTAQAACRAVPARWPRSSTTQEIVRISVRDDGVGGADLTRGSGLVRLKDRVDALAGRISVDSLPGAGTVRGVTRARLGARPASSRPDLLR
jgi:signal transduction histidine kinase